MNSRQIAAIRFVSVAIVAMVLFFNVDLAAKESVNRPAVESGSSALVDAHGCSSAVQDPTHVVVTKANGQTVYGGQRLTDRAVEQAVFGMDHGLTVHAFCP